MISNTLSKWEKRSRESQWAHYEQAKLFICFHNLLNITTILASCICSAFLFFDWDRLGLQVKTFNPAIFFSILAFVSSSLSLYINGAIKSDKHNELGMKFGKLRRLIEEKNVPEFDNLDGILSEIRKEYDMISLRALPVTN